VVDLAGVRDLWYCKYFVEQVISHKTCLIFVYSSVCLVGWFVGLSIRLSVWLVCWFVGLLVCWLVCWLVGWLYSLTRIVWGAM